MAAVGNALVAIGLAGAWLASPAAAAPAGKTFRDWIVGCDNLKSCTALSLPGEAAEHVSFLKLTRPAGPEGAPRLELKLRSEKLESPLRITIAADGVPFPEAGRSWNATSVDGETAEIALSPAEAQALIGVARKATKLTVAIAERRFEISLAGSVAALLWIDEQQGRLNTASALIRKGPGTSVPAAPALPVLRSKGTALPAIPAKAAAALTAALRSELKRSDPDSCGDKPDGFDSGDNAWPLDGGRRLVGLLCSAGAYNFSTGYWIVPGTDVTKARKALFPQLNGTAHNALVNADYDPATGQLSFFSKGRGLGDCGAAGGYAWTGTGFAMTRFAEMGECRGLLADDWITLFRSEVKVVK